MTIRISLFALLLAFSASASAQTPLPARQVSASTNAWTNLTPSAATAQATFDWLDANWEPGLVTTNWLFLDPAEDTAQSTFDWLDAYAGTNGLLRGTNIFGFTFTNGVWTPPADLVGVENFAFVRDTNLTSSSSWTVRVATNASWDADSLAWTTNPPGTNAAAFFGHPPFIVADDVMFPSFVSKEEFYAILNSLGFANFESFTFVEGAYGSSTNPPDNDSVQLWTVPASELVTTGQVIRVHAWGGGGSYQFSYGCGGYAYADLVVSNEASLTDPWVVTNGMVLCVQVGDAYGRAAVWRYDSSLDFSSYTNELLVAGGAGEASGGAQSGGGGGASGSSGLAYAGTDYSGSAYSAGGGSGGGALAGGAGGVVSGGLSSDAGDAGGRVWGGAGGRTTYYSGHRAGAGGDGYWGGGGGGEVRPIARGDPNGWNRGGGGGGGSGFVAPGLTGGTVGPGYATMPPGTTNVAYGLNAGYPGNPGRVAFEIRFGSWGRTNAPSGE